MGRYDQAPKLVNKKPKLNGNTIMISNDVFISIMNKKDITPKQALLLIWLVGQADGFGVAKETATKAMGLKEHQGYYKLRRGLEKAGYLDVTDTSIIINYDKILEQQSVDPISLGQPEDDPILGKQIVDPILEQRMDDPILGGQEDDPIFLGQQMVAPMGQPLDDPMGQQIAAHNIEEHRKTYKDQNKKLGQLEDDPILSDDFNYVQDAMDSFVKEQQKKKWVF